MFVCFERDGRILGGQNLGRANSFGGQNLGRAPFDGLIFFGDCSFFAGENTSGGSQFWGDF